MGLRSGLSVYRADTREPAEHVWADTVLLGTSEGRGWSGIAAEAGRCRAWDADSLCFTEHWIALNTGTEPHVVERKVGGRTVRTVLGPGQLRVTPANWAFTRRLAGPTRWGGVQLSLDKVVRVLGRPLDLHEVYGLDDPRLVALVRMAVGEVVSPEAADPLYAEGIAIGILGRLAALFGPSSTASTGTLDERRLRVVVDSIEAELAKRHTIDDMAQLAGLSPAHFARAFKQRTGVTPHAFVMRTRLERARLRLMAGSSIIAAATECGFADQAHLSRLFKRRFGVTPGELVRQGRR
jgi:AraC family transcriptional regulator